MPHIISMEYSLKSVHSRFGHAVKFYDDGIGPLWLYQSADFDFGVIRAQTWEDAYECVEDEILPRATHEEMLADFPGYQDYDKMDKHDAACFDEAYGMSGNNGWFHKPMNGETLEPLTPERCKAHGLKLRWERYE